MGVKITGVGTDKLTVMRGTLHTSIEYEICPDRIVAGTYLYSVVSAGGEVILKNVPLQHMKQTIQMAGKLGAKLHRDGKDMKIMMEQQVRSIPYLRTAPYPGFPTDLQSPLVAALCKADGESRIEERIFENRFLIVEELEKMGARIQIKDRIAHIYPAKELLAAELTAKELRGGAALVLAAQSAIGTSVIRNAEIIDRGYEDLVGDFEKMGARIRRIP